ncbi:hypothetical protein GCM10010174_65880 [Kutzneria viridogrisea]|uniref:CAAX prenyl protease 2/Lysostaphin resistance protein A-like domain-containing protein n=2 Tax=Kutzneria TaxID=43356 RepID=W5WG75_9PSEU|nr:CPBP family intramembrane glutamic endopeptidase [Kutzneria albida]AHH97149.1 hypothetical protein KALB_3785 [Kutzneria albida DSM 43870]MBA8931880.1 membrane protease YdiL (CAAX protease family) [Kutzneria viridogrisea]
MTAVLPYHRMAHTGPYRWWRPLFSALLLLGFGTLLLMGSVVVAYAVGLITGLARGEGSAVFADPVADTAVQLFTLAMFIPAVLLAVSLGERRPAGTVCSVRGRLRWNWLARCVLIALPAVVLLLALHIGLAIASSQDTWDGDFGEWQGWPRFLAGALVVLLLCPLQAAGEEFLCRGWLVQWFGGWLRSPWPGILASGLVFSLLHGFGQPGGFLELILWGATAAWLTVRTGGLEAAIALHVVNNLVALLLAAAFGGLGGEGSAADASWPALVAAVLVMPGYAWLTAKSYNTMTSVSTKIQPSGP